MVEEKYQKLLKRLEDMDEEKREMKRQVENIKGLEEERLKQVKINERLREDLEK